MNRQGVAIPLALAIMVGVSILAATALQVALADLQANRASRLATRAMLSAEAGAERTLVTWSTGPFSALTPGDSASTGWVNLPDHSRYRSVALRVDDGSTDLPIYLVRTEGRPSRQSTARRQLITMVQGGADEGMCCGAAVTVRGRLRLRAPNAPRGAGRGWTPNPQADGRDHVPSEWAGTCPVPDPGVAGVRIERERDLMLQRDATATGNPPVLEDGSIGSDGVDRLGSTTYDALVSAATLTLARNARYRNDIRPSARRGVCDTSDDSNWGAPESSGSACWDYLPVIHAAGNLRIDGDGEGQGILLVDGDLTWTGGLDFYGVVVVRGTLVMRGEGTITGGLVVGNRDNGRGNSQIRDDALVRYSSCAVARVSGRASTVRFLPGRHWFEIP